MEEASRPREAWEREWVWEGESKENWMEGEDSCEGGEEGKSCEKNERKKQCLATRKMGRERDESRRDAKLNSPPDQLTSIPPSFPFFAPHQSPQPSRQTSNPSLLLQDARQVQVRSRELNERKKNTNEQKVSFRRVNSFDLALFPVVPSSFGREAQYSRALGVIKPTSSSSAC